MQATAGSLAVWLLLVLAARADEPASISPARPLQGGVLLHEVRSPDQAAATQIRVLPPARLEPGKKYPSVYLLPVEAGTGSRYGDGLQEVQRLALHDRLGALFVAPTFSHLPWYADHPTRSDLRQESYFVNVVVPFIDAHYPVQPAPDGRLLLGFSKSGFGAWALLLRHPDQFGKAAAWDAPLMLDRPGKYGSGDVFGSDENFARYRLSTLLELEASRLGGAPRLILLGYGNFREEHQRMHALLEQLRIPHVYRDGPPRKHDWHSGWVEEAVQLLLPRSNASP
jgi:S-formylglutathione hydrolase FrmB